MADRNLFERDQGDLSGLLLLPFFQVLRFLFIPLFIVSQLATLPASFPPPSTFSTKDSEIKPASQSLPGRTKEDADVARYTKERLLSETSSPLLPSLSFQHQRHQPSSVDRSVFVSPLPISGRSLLPLARSTARPSSSSHPSGVSTPQRASAASSSSFPLTSFLELGVERLLNARRLDTEDPEKTMNQERLLGRLLSFKRDRNPVEEIPPTIAALAAAARRRRLSTSRSGIDSSPLMKVSRVSSSRSSSSFFDGEEGEKEKSRPPPVSSRDLPATPDSLPVFPRLLFEDSPHSPVSGNRGSSVSSSFVAFGSSENPSEDTSSPSVMSYTPTEGESREGGGGVTEFFFWILSLDIVRILLVLLLSFTNGLYSTVAVLNANASAHAAAKIQHYYQHYFHKKDDSSSSAEGRARVEEILTAPSSSMSTPPTPLRGTGGGGAEREGTHERERRRGGGGGGTEDGDDEGQDDNTYMIRSSSMYILIPEEKEALTMGAEEASQKARQKVAFAINVAVVAGLCAGSWSGAALQFCLPRTR